MAMVMRFMIMHMRHGYTVYTADKADARRSAGASTLRVIPERASCSVTCRRHRPTSVGTPGACATAMAKAAHAAELGRLSNRQTAHGHSRRARAP